MSTGLLSSRVMWIPGADEHRARILDFAAAPIKVPTRLDRVAERKPAVWDFSAANQLSLDRRRNDPYSRRPILPVFPQGVNRVCNIALPACCVFYLSQPASRRLRRGRISLPPRGQPPCKGWGAAAPHGDAGHVARTARSGPPGRRPSPA